MNEIDGNDFKYFFKYTKEIKELPPIPENFDATHLQEFIDEFESSDNKMNDKIYPSMVIRSQAEAIELLEKENKCLNRQLEYLRSGEYLNQLKFERNMLEDIVQNMEVPKEDKEFIDMTHRNTELLEENQELKDRINKVIKLMNSELTDVGMGESEEVHISFVEHWLKILKENKQLKEDLHQASIGIQELIEQDIMCPTTCDKLQRYESVLDEIREYITNNRLFNFVPDEEELFEYVSDGKAKSELLQILDKSKGE